MEGASIDTAELAWLHVLCSLPWRVNELPGWSTDGFLPDSMSTGRSNGTADWLKNRGPIWPGSGALLFDPNVTENLGIGSRVEGKSNFSSEMLSSSGSF